MHVNPSKGLRGLTESTQRAFHGDEGVPSVEYGNVIWGPHSKSGKQDLEKVQRRATRLIPTLRKLTYSSRIQRLKLPSLEYRRQRGDRIQVYKIMAGLERIPVSCFFAPAEQTVTRGHRFKLQVPLARSRVRGQAFSVRTVNNWNSLPDTVVEADSINQSKTRLDKHWEDTSTQYERVKTRTQQADAFSLVGSIKVSRYTSSFTLANIFDLNLPTQPCL